MRKDVDSSVTPPYEEGRTSLCLVPGGHSTPPCDGGYVFLIPREVGNNDSGVLFSGPSSSDGARRTGLFVTEFHSLAAASGLQIYSETSSKSY